VCDQRTVHRPGVNPAGGGGGIAMRCKWDVYCPVDYRTGIGGKYDTPELPYYTQTENIKQLIAACSECTFTVFCGRCNNIVD
jgi:hypothetical protein